MCYWGGGPADLNTCHYHTTVFCQQSLSYHCVCSTNSVTQQIVTVASCGRFTETCDHERWQTSWFYKRGNERHQKVNRRGHPGSIFSVVSGKCSPKTNTTSLILTVLKRSYFNFMIILEAAVCGAVGLYCVMLAGVSIILSTPFRLNNRNTSLYNAVQFNSTTKYIL